MTEKLACQVLTLPLYPEMTGNAVKKVASRMKRFAEVDLARWEYACVERRSGVALTRGRF